MPYLTELSEWRLIQEIAEWLSQRKAPCHVQPNSINNQLGYNAYADLLEFELRRTFMVQEFPQNLSQAEFECCQEALEHLCSLLDGITSHQNTCDDSKGQKYTHLRALRGILESTSGKIDLVNGPNKSLFKLPDNATDLGNCLRTVTECNNALSELLAPPTLEPVIQPYRIQRERSAWKKNKIRNEAICVLRILFEHFKCGMSHEVLLKLNQVPNKDLAFPSLQLMLSLCPELELWQEVQCDTIQLDDASISCISDICTSLRQYTGQGKALKLRIKGNELYGAWAGPISSGQNASSKESLAQLIKDGVFKRPDVKALENKAASIKFSTNDKRRLAVKLGYCLMDFFDADFNSKRIHLLGSSKSSSKEIPYLSFNSEFPSAESSYSFEMGHPTLLSFAKLLLELELGQIIELEVSPDSCQNHTTWAELLRYVDLLERHKSDSYVQAIRSCLLVYQNIAMKLNSRGPDSKGTDSKIRKIIYKHIVWKLELGLTESTPRPSRKRQRSESPPTSDCQDRVQDSGSGKISRPVARLRPPSTNKRRRAPELQRWLSHLSIKSSFKENINSLKNDALEFGVTTYLDQPQSREDFEIALICALQVESDAVEALFDDYYEEKISYGKAPGDPNAYTTGRMAGHNVVLAFMPGIGKVNSANVAAGFRASFPKIKLGMVVGICGGVPGGAGCEKEVLLGDVIISTALIQYDFGRQYDNKIVRRDTLQDNLNRPTAEIRAFLAKHSGLRGRKKLREKTSSYLEDLCEREDFENTWYPGAKNDKLYHPSYLHKHHNPEVCSVCASCQGPYDDVCDEALKSSCADLGCQDSMTISRGRVDKVKRVLISRNKPIGEGLREAWKPFIHFGTIVSGDSIMKSGLRRDIIASQENAIAFEMEGAGVWDNFPTVVIKGVCDYADSHKNKMWQRYAAATAGACMKAFLGEWRKAC
ncbi:hypothetical protein GGI43DRAFT_408965 [Trichoderma evansii]